MSERRPEEDFLSDIIHRARAERIPMPVVARALRADSPLAEAVTRFLKPIPHSASDIDFVSVASLISLLRRVPVGDRREKAALQYDVMCALAIALQNFAREFYPEGFEVGFNRDEDDFVVRVGLDKVLQRDDLKELERAKLAALDVK